jgi:hypothetical protein
MVNELTVKEYAGAKGQPTIIVADLTTKMHRTLINWLIIWL